jgi:hypothetical protein
MVEFLFYTYYQYKKDAYNRLLVVYVFGPQKAPPEGVPVY